MRGIIVSIIALVFFGAAVILLWLREKKHTDKIAAELDTYYEKLKEKRRTIRLNKRLRVICKVIEKPNSHWAVFSKDVSGEGICLYLPEILPRHAVVDLEIDMPGEKRIHAHGQVVWVREIETPNAEGKRQFSAGIKFVKINPKDKDSLIGFLTASIKPGR